MSTSEDPEEEAEIIYEYLEELIQIQQKGTYIVVMDDFNVVVGER